MNCQYCDNPIPPGVATCPSCGAQVPVQPQPQQNFQQPQQNFQQPPMQGYPQQGYPQQGYPQPQGVYPGSYMPTKSRVAYILLGLFLGGLGIHNFYAGRTGAGVAQLLITLCTCGYGGVITGIWALIEICTVNTDGRGIRMS